MYFSQAVPAIRQIPDGTFRVLHGRLTRILKRCHQESELLHSVLFFLQFFRRCFRCGRSLFSPRFCIPVLSEALVELVVIIQYCVQVRDARASLIDLRITAFVCLCFTGFQRLFPLLQALSAFLQFSDLLEGRFPVRLCLFSGLIVRQDFFRCFGQRYPAPQRIYRFLLPFFLLQGSLSILPLAQQAIILFRHGFLFRQAVLPFFLLLQFASDFSERLLLPFYDHPNRFRQPRMIRRQACPLLLIEVLRDHQQVDSCLLLQRQIIRLLFQNIVRCGKPELKILVPPVVKELSEYVSAVVALCFQEAAELPLRKHDDAAELVGIQADNLRNLRGDVIVGTAFFFGRTCQRGPVFCQDGLFAGRLAVSLHPRVHPAQDGKSSACL